MAALCRVTGMLPCTCPGLADQRGCRANELLLCSHTRLPHRKRVELVGLETQACRTALPRPSWQQTVKATGHNKCAPSTPSAPGNPTQIRRAGKHTHYTAPPGNHFFRPGDTLSTTHACPNYNQPAKTICHTGYNWDHFLKTERDSYSIRLIVTNTEYHSKWRDTRIYLNEGTRKNSRDKS